MLTENENVIKKAEIEEEQAEHKEPESVEIKEESNSMQELIKLLQERLKLYEIAEEKAKRNDETGKARRYNRGIKTLKEMLISVQSGTSVNEADIPPVLPSSATAESTDQYIDSTYFFKLIFHDYFSFCSMNLLIICNWFYILLYRIIFMHVCISAHVQKTDEKIECTILYFSDLIYTF